jgi:CHAT domain-containing protein
VTAPGEEQRAIAEHYLSEIYGVAVEPLLPLLVGEELLILADGDFAQIPFIALCDERGGYLKKRFKIKLVFNPKEIGRANGQPPRFAARRSAAFGAPSETLPLVEQECRQLLRSFGRTRLYLGEDAGGDNLKSELSRCGGFVHIAAHAARSSENPLFSRILMADGPFFPFDLFGAGIKARLVTLSGCQTAAPGLYYGNSFSLARAFGQAGSQYVIASLWPVADEVTMLFMARFYDKLRETDDIRESYYQAIEEAKAATANPALWGAFVLLGL